MRGRSDKLEGLAEGDERGDDSDDAYFEGLALGAVEVVVGDENVEDVPDEEEDLGLHDLCSHLHIQHLPLVGPLHEDYHYLCQALQGSENVLQPVHLHTAGVVHHCLLLAYDFEFPEEDAVVAKEEEHSEEVLEDGEYLEGLGGGREGLLHQFLHLPADGGGVLDGPQEPQDLSGPAHLRVYIVGGALAGMILGVEGQVLHQSQQLTREGVTVSLLDVLLSRPRKAFRYDINFSDIISFSPTVACTLGLDL